MSVEGKLRRVLRALQAQCGGSPGGASPWARRAPRTCKALGVGPRLGHARDRLERHHSAHLAGGDRLLDDSDHLARQQQPEDLRLEILFFAHHEWHAFYPDSDRALARYPLRALRAALDHLRLVPPKKGRWLGGFGRRWRRGHDRLSLPALTQGSTALAATALLFLRLGFVAFLFFRRWRSRGRLGLAALLTIRQWRRCSRGGLGLADLLFIRRRRR